MREQKRTLKVSLLPGQTWRSKSASYEVSPWETRFATAGTSRRCNRRSRGTSWEQFQWATVRDLWRATGYLRWIPYVACTCRGYGSTTDRELCGGDIGANVLLCDEWCKCQKQRMERNCYWFYLNFFISKYLELGIWRVVTALTPTLSIK